MGLLTHYPEHLIMANEWLRLWHDMPTDPKWRTIARHSKQPIALVQAVYLHLLVDASRNVTRGHVTVTIEDLSSALDCDEEQIKAILEAMQDRVLDGDFLSGWHARQPKKEDKGNDETGAKSAAERKAEERARKKALTDQLNKSQQVTESHGMSRIVTTDKDKDKDKDKEETNNNNTCDLANTEAEKKEMLLSPPRSHEQVRCSEIAVLLRHRGAALTHADPRVIDWATTGITDTQLLQALDTAKAQREEQNNPKPINAGYLDAILQSQTQQRPRSRDRPMTPAEKRSQVAQFMFRNLPENLHASQSTVIDITPDREA